MNALALIPLKDHPDAELFGMVDRATRFREEWEAALAIRNQRKREQALRDICRKTGTAQINLDARIARYNPRTIEGLVAKADLSLHSWRDEDTGNGRYGRMWASMATSLEIAMATLQALPEAPPVVVPEEVE